MSQNLTIHKGEQTHTMPMNTPTHAINAIRNSQTETRVSAIVNATDYQSLIKHYREYLEIRIHEIGRAHV